MLSDRLQTMPEVDKTGYARLKIEGKYCLFFRKVKLISPLVEEKVVSKFPDVMCGVP